MAICGQPWVVQHRGNRPKQRETETRPVAATILLWAFLQRGRCNRLPNLNTTSRCLPLHPSLTFFFSYSLTLPPFHPSTLSPRNTPPCRPRPPIYRNQLPSVFTRPRLPCSLSPLSACQHRVSIAHSFPRRKLGQVMRGKKKKKNYHAVNLCCTPDQYDPAHPVHPIQALRLA